MQCFFHFFFGEHKFRLKGAAHMGHSMSNQQRISINLSDFFHILGNDCDPWEMGKKLKKIALDLVISEIHANELWAN